ncbi:syntaxin binding protein 6 (amisyn), like [Ictalurus punctatus]|uniref:Syntaxin binding protein 6 (Amisyn), like n=1 Tax=Ictalurus punctatus TaxID=7998 RepID=A0A2D0Q094_ICTPU|nr:syntaxin binding protein 6 (amisyn), like [Ictalurus punctatus]
MMTIQSAISRDIFTPHHEKLLTVIEVRKRRRRRLNFIPAGRKGDYITFLCLSVTNRKPTQVFITKVKQFEFSPQFEKRSHWSLDQLRRVDGIDPDKDSPEFDLVFDHRSDQWVAASSAEKCMFIQILYHLCQHYWRKQIDLSVTAPPVGQKPTTPTSTSTTTPPSTATTTPASTSNEQTPGLKKKQKKGRDAPRPTEFVNCQSKLLGDACSLNIVIYRCKIFLHRMRNSMTSAQEPSHSQKASPVKVRVASSSPPAQSIMGTVGRRASQVFSVDVKHLTENTQKFALKHRD